MQVWTEKTLFAGLAESAKKLLTNYDRKSFHELEVFLNEQCGLV